MADTRGEEPPVGLETKQIFLDIGVHPEKAKRTFQLHGAGADGSVVFR